MVDGFLPALDEIDLNTPIDPRASRVAAREQYTCKLTIAG